MKALLVIDMPKDCIECETHCEFCHLTGNCRPPKCPLKPMPFKKEGYQTGGTLWNGDPEVRFNEYALGWNACLDELEK